MTIDVELLLDWRTLGVLLGLVAFLPGVSLRQFVRLYPQGHPRRRELVAELYVRPYHERLFYVVQCLEVSFAEGLPARWSSRRGRRQVVAPESVAVTGELDVLKVRLAELELRIEEVQQQPKSRRADDLMKVVHDEFTDVTNMLVHLREKALQQPGLVQLDEVRRITDTIDGVLNNLDLSTE